MHASDSGGNTSSREHTRASSYDRAHEVDTGSMDEDCTDNQDEVCSSNSRNTDNNDSSDESSSYDQDSFCDSDEDTVRSRRSVQPSLASLEVDESALILESASSQSCLDVPVVCMAGPAVMPSVMSKILHQRGMMNLRDPVIGIIISDDGLHAQYAIGWVEDDGIEVGHFRKNSS